MSPADAEERTFRYRAVTVDGRRVRDQVRASGAEAALRTLAAEGLVVIALEAAPARWAGRGRGVPPADQLALLRQLALMTEAGVGLLDAVRLTASGLEGGRGRAEMEAVAISLTRGRPFADALESDAPSLPYYVPALCRVGAATGRLGEVLSAAAEQMAHDQALRRDVSGALTYPSFLLAAGAAAVLFIFIQVVPRFAAMIGPRRADLPLLSRTVFAVGEAASAHPWVAPTFLLAAAGAALTAQANPVLGRWAYGVARRVPLVGRAIRAREIAGWARLMAFALDHGVSLLPAAALARRAVPAGPMRAGLAHLERELKAGVELDAALGRHTTLSATDLSLLRAGLRSGAAAQMFTFIAEAHEARLREILKQLTTLLEPLAVGLISVLVGAIALSLLLAMSSVYDSVG